MQVSRRVTRLLAVAAVGCALAGCAGTEDEQGDPVGSGEVDEGDDDRASEDVGPTSRPSFDRSDLEEAASAAATSPRPSLRDESPGDLPSPATTLAATLLDPVLADAADRTGVAPDELQVVRAQPVRWSDGSLGCPEPDRVYTQAVVEGSWVVLRAGDRELDYRLGSSGGFRLCTSGT